MSEEKDKREQEELLNEEDASTPETDAGSEEEAPVDAPASAQSGRPSRFGRLMQEEAGVRKLAGMYKNWFLDYASYVILERAVPQRRGWPQTRAATHPPRHEGGRRRPLQ